MLVLQKNRVSQKTFTTAAVAELVLPPLIDLHEDISLYYVMGGYGLKFKVEDFAKDIKGSHGDIPKFRRANVKLVFSSMAPLFPTLDTYRSEQLSRGYGHATSFRFRSPTTIVLEHIKTYLNLFKSHGDQLQNVLRKEDLSKVFHDRKIGFLIAMEGAEAVEDVEDVELFYRLGLRSLQLTWNFDNKYAAACMSKKDYGLTGDGEKLVEVCNELGVVVDLAHASKKAVMEACRLSRLPLIVSHANVMSVHGHVRNLDDEELEAVKRSRGVVGMTFITSTISKRPTYKKLAEHIMYVYENFGVDLLAVGTDYFGLLNSGEPQGLEDITKIRNLWAELSDRGLRKSELEKIAYLNALRVVEESARRWKSN